MTEPRQKGRGRWDVFSELSDRSTSLEIGSSGRRRGSTQGWGCRGCSSAWKPISWAENLALSSHRNAELLKILPKEETTIPVPTHEAGVQEAKSKAGSEGVSQIRRDQVLTSSDGNVGKMGQNEGLLQRSSHPRGQRRRGSKTKSPSSGLKEGPDN